MRILFLSHNFYPVIGGIEINSDIFAQAFTDAGHEVHLLTWSKDLTNKKFPFLIVRNPSKSKLILEHVWADLVFENNPSLRLAWPSLFFKKPSVIVLNTWISRPNGKIWLQDKIKIWWLKRATKVIAVSDALRKRCWPAAIVIANPYRINQFRIIPNIKKISDFVFLGRLVSDKGADHAIKALHLLITTKPEIKYINNKPSLTIIGNGPERSNLLKLIAALKMEDYVNLTGSLTGEELTVCLNQHRFLLVPSLWEEPFGNVVLEAMACGCLPIVSDGGGLPDAIGNAGITFNRGSINSLADSITRIMYDHALEQQLKDAAKLHLTTHFPKIVAQRYLEVVNLALQQSK